jgi:hypothetical protein
VLGLLPEYSRLLPLEGEQLALYALGLVTRRGRDGRQ